MILLTRAEIEAAKARADAATPGPWTSDASANVIAGDGYVAFGLQSNAIDYHPRNKANAVFTAAARTDVPALCATLRAAILLLKRWDTCYWKQEEHRHGGLDAQTHEFLAQVKGETT